MRDGLPSLLKRATREALRQVVRNQLRPVAQISECLLANPVLHAWVMGAAHHIHCMGCTLKRTTEEAQRAESEPTHPCVSRRKFFELSGSQSCYDFRVAMQPFSDPMRLQHMTVAVHLTLLIDLDSHGVS